MTQATFLIGDVRDRLSELADDSIDLVVTSPPFLALRDYLPADHPDKDREIGTEPTPAAFISTLLSITAELRRVLASHGSIVVELGDTYAGSGGAGGDYTNEHGLRAGQPAFTGSARRQTGDAWPMAKSLTLIPEMYRLALAYGIDPATGAESPAGRWRIRNVVTWCRPNPPVGALADKYRPATSDLVVATIARDRYFDLTDVRTENDRVDEPGRTGEKLNHGAFSTTGEPGMQNPDGAPPRDYWIVSNNGYTGSHYATFPADLITIPIQSMTPPRVCRTCREPSRRLTERTRTISSDATEGGARSDAAKQGGPLFPSGDVIVSTRDLGWSDCGHDDWRPGVVLDPFAGTGTTLAVATGHGFDAIGIDIDERNAVHAEQRVGGLFATIIEKGKPWNA